MANGDRSFRTHSARATSKGFSSSRELQQVLSLPHFTALRVDLERCSVVPIEMAAEGKRFAATGWEKLYCLPLTNNLKPFRPIVTPTGELIAWHGAVNGKRLWTRETPPNGQEAIKFDEFPIRAHYYFKLSHPAEGVRHFDSIRIYECVFSIDGEVLTIVDVRMVDQSVQNEGLGVILDVLTGAVIVKNIAGALLRRVLAKKAASATANSLGKAVGRKIGGAVDSITPRVQEVAEEGAQLVNKLRSAGSRVTVNIGGVGEEVGAINLNPNLVAPRTGIPNLIARPAEEIGNVFRPGTIDSIVSNRLPPNTIDWTRVIPGAHRVLAPGAKLVIRFQGIGEDAAVIMPLLKSLGFEKVKNISGAAIEAVK